MPDLNHPLPIGALIYDLASRRAAKITKVEPLFDDRDIELGGDGTKLCYLLDDNIPLDPTHDGAFPNRWRLASEICALDRESIATGTTDFSY